MVLEILSSRLGESDLNGLSFTLPNAILPIIGLGSAAIDVRPLSAGIVLQHGRSQTLEKRFYEFVCQNGPLKPSAGYEAKVNSWPQGTLNCLSLKHSFDTPPLAPQKQ